MDPIHNHRSGSLVNLYVHKPSIDRAQCIRHRMQFGDGIVSPLLTQLSKPKGMTFFCGYRYNGFLIVVASRQ
jgi:hypothetical protein